MKIKSLAVAAFTSVFVTAAAHAVTITATDATGATSSPFTLISLGTAASPGLVSTAPITLSTGIVTFAPNSSIPQAGVYFGSVPGTSSSAFASTGFAPANYLVAEPGDPLNFNFYAPQTSFSLLWGTVDTYNSLNLVFTSGGSSTTTTITGAQVAAAIGGTAFKLGTSPAFVTISGVGSFNSVVATSTQQAFEFVPAGQIPEPASIAILGAGLAGLGLIRRRRAGDQA